MFSNRASKFVIPGLLALGWVIIGYFLIQFAAYTIKNKIVLTQIENDVYANKIGDIVRTIVLYVGWTFNILIAFQIMGLNVGILMAGISFGIGFAMQQILENMMAGFLILTNSMYKIGETVNILGDFNTLGFIESLQSRYTVVRQFDGKKLVIPNTIFLKTPIQTYKREEVIRSEVVFTVEYHIPIDKLQAIIKQQINTHPALVQKEQTKVIPKVVDGAGTSFTVYFYMSPKQSELPLFVIQSDLRKIIMKTLNTYHVTVPYPKKIVDFV